VDLRRPDRRSRWDTFVPKEVHLDGISAAAGANATGQVAAAVQVFALKQATNATASAAATLLQTIAPPSSMPGPSLPHLGNSVDASV
jgi:hypothetical protein